MKKLVVLVLFAACSLKPTYTREEIERARLLDGAPAGFLLGAATAPHQVEGDLDNDWTEWEKGTFPDGRPHIVDGKPSGRAADSWNRWPEDIAALRKLGANGYRLGIEWSRLEPTEGAWDAEAAARYRQMLQALKDAGITPMVTLYHFTLPRWFSDKGGWAGWSGAPEAMERYVIRAAQEFGDLVDIWCTINEPNVYSFKGYVEGVWPPGEKDTARMVASMAALLRAHARAATALRTHDTVDADGDGKATSIGIAHHVRIFEPASWSPLDGVITGLSDEVFNESIPRAVKTGRIEISVPGSASVDEEVPGLKDSFDWLGLNYYSRDFVRTDLGDPALSRQYSPEDRPKNDLKWDIYPEGLHQLLVRFGEYGWPLYVTENGIADVDGAERAFFLRAHLYALDRARADGADVRGYFHWSLIDNYEWAEGYTAPFGLFTIDFDSAELERIPTPGVPVFQEAARNLGLTPVE